MKEIRTATKTFLLSIIIASIFYVATGNRKASIEGKENVSIELKEYTGGPIEMTILTFCDDIFLVGEELYECPAGTLLGGQPNWEWTSISSPTVIDISAACPTFDTEEIECGELYEYELTVTACDCGGCQEKTTISFILPCDGCPELFVDAGEDITICEGESAVLGGMPTASGGTPAYTYGWTVNGGASIFSTSANPTVSPANGNTYIVTVTDECGETGTDAIVVTTAESPEITIETQIDDDCNTPECEGEITISIAGGTPAYDIDWSTGATTETVDMLCADTYTVIVTDSNGCTDEETIIINTEPSPMCAATGTNNTDCVNPNGTATVTPSGGTPPYNVLWSTGGTTNTITGLVGGSYTVTVTDANGCTCIQQVNITDDCIGCADVAVGGTTTPENCGQEDGTINVTTDACQPAIFSWTNGIPNTQNPTGLEAGMYSVTVTDCLGCTGTAVYEVLEAGEITITANTTAPECGDNGAIDITVAGTGTAPYTYEWNGGTYTTEDLTNIGYGTYTVIVTDANGCEGTYTVTFEEEDCECTEILVEADDIVIDQCGLFGNTSITVTGGAPAYNYVIQHPDPNTQTVVVTGGFYIIGGLDEIGTYTITVTDQNGCVGTGSFQLSYSFSCECPLAFPSDTNGNGVDDFEIPFDAATQCGINCNGLPNNNLFHIKFPLDLLCDLEPLGYDTYEIWIDGVQTGTNTIPWNIPNLTELCINFFICPNEDSEIAIRLLSDCCDEIYEIYTIVDCIEPICEVEITEEPASYTCDTELCWEGNCGEGLWVIFLDGVAVDNTTGTSFCFTIEENGEYLLEYSGETPQCFDDNFADIEFEITDCCECTPTAPTVFQPKFVECNTNDDWVFSSGGISGGDCQIICPENGTAEYYYETTIDGIVVFTSPTTNFTGECGSPLIGSTGGNITIPYNANIVGDTYSIETTFYINGVECTTLSQQGEYESCCDCPPEGGQGTAPSFVECIDQDFWLFDSGNADCQITCDEHDGDVIVEIETYFNGTLVFSNSFNEVTDCELINISGGTFQIPYNASLVGQSWFIESIYTIDGEECATLTRTGIYEECVDPCEDSSLTLNATYGGIIGVSCEPINNGSIVTEMEITIDAICDPDDCFCQTAWKLTPLGLNILVNGGTTNQGYTGPIYSGISCGGSTTETFTVSIPCEYIDANGDTQNIEAGDHITLEGGGWLVQPQGNSFGCDNIFVSGDFLIIYNYTVTALDLNCCN